jgi:hypothetical protein
MLATRCACGFERLEDERLMDHLLAVFEPDDSTGADGLVHLEMATLVCSCGFQAASSDELDSHFLEVFTRTDQIGRDGRKHESIAPVAQ